KQTQNRAYSGLLIATQNLVWISCVLPMKH
ncbi:uncharacterized protein METZ01_LOCUS257995, partial [marine metagenome]